MRVCADYIEFTYPDYTTGYPSEGADYTGIGYGTTVEEALRTALEVIYQSMDNPDDLDWNALEKECLEQLSEALEYPDSYEFANQLGFNLDDNHDDCPYHYIGIRLWL